MVLGKITVNVCLIELNPGEIDFGSSWRGFELSGVGCISFRLFLFVF